MDSGAVGEDGDGGDSLGGRLVEEDGEGVGEDRWRRRRGEVRGIMAVREVAGGGGQRGRRGGSMASKLVGEDGDGDYEDGGDDRWHRSWWGEDGDGSGEDASGGGS